MILAGCATPDLAPFSEATATLKTAVKQAGDLTVQSIATQTVTIQGQAIAPGDENHPAAELKKSWEKRRRAMEAVAAYSASLAAIADASENRKANAEAVVGAVQELAANCGFSTGTGAAGDILVTVGSTIIELKAHRDLSRAVSSVQPVAAAIAKALTNDFQELAALYESALRREIRRLKNEREGPDAYFSSLIQRRNSLRSAGAGLAADSRREEMAALSSLVAAVQPEIESYDSQIAAHQLALENGLRFYSDAALAIDAWQRAHAEVQRALDENRRPNLSVLMSRALELRELVQQIKAGKQR